MEHIDEKMTRLQMYHRVIDEIATALGYRMGDTFEPEVLVEKVKQLKAVFVAAKTWKASLDTPTALAAAEAWDDDTAPEYRDACATLSAAIAYAELAKENYIAMATLAALREPSEAVTEKSAIGMHNASEPDGDGRIEWEDCIPWYHITRRKMATAAIQAAVAAAEQEVSDAKP